MSVSALDSVGQARHRWYFFKEAFSSEVVKRATKDAGCNADDLIFDPFCGSGTVTLQSALDGHRSAGIEVNPFLAFVARTKLKQCSPATFEAHAEDAIRRAKRGKRSPLEGYSTFTATSDASKWLFNVSVLRAFEAAWSGLDMCHAPEHDLIRLCLLGAAMDAANVVKDGKCLRYLRDWREKNFDGETFTAAFEARAKCVTTDLMTAPLERPMATIKQGDVRRIAPNVLRGMKFRLCVTSPPYLNSFDYSDVYRPELFLGRWVRTTADLRALRSKTLRSHLQIKWTAPTENDFGARYAESLERLKPLAPNLWNGRIPLMIQAYFEDMRRVLKVLRQHASEEASVWIIVSTSAYAGVEIPVDLIIADIAATSGWYLREVSVVRYLGQVAGQQWDNLSKQKANRPHLRESVVILDAHPRRVDGQVAVSQFSGSLDSVLYPRERVGFPI